MAYDADNVFAKILRGEIPSYKVYEDDKTLAFMDVMPQAAGHTLVIPKEPAQDIYELSPEGAANLIVITQKIAKAVRQALGVPGVQIMQLNGRGAGQTVYHVHFHVIPRRLGNELALHAQDKEKPERLKEVAEQIKAALEHP